MKLDIISSLNMRMGRKGIRHMDDTINFTCSCGKRKKLGKNAGVMVRIVYSIDSKNYKAVLCDDCADKLVDIIRFGPSVLLEGNGWKKKSNIARASKVDGELFCFKCLAKDKTHLFVKYDDLRSKGKENYSTIRVCARCALTYLTMMLDDTEPSDLYKDIKLEVVE